MWFARPLKKNPQNLLPPSTGLKVSVLVVLELLCCVVVVVAVGTDTPYTPSPWDARGQPLYHDGLLTKEHLIVVGVQGAARLCVVSPAVSGSSRE